MNAGIVILTDGTPCIAFDEALPHLVRHVVFDAETYQISLVYDVAEDVKKMFEYPLDPPFLAVLREKKEVALAQTINGELIDISMFSVIFT